MRLGALPAFRPFVLGITEPRRDLRHTSFARRTDGRLKTYSRDIDLTFVAKLLVAPTLTAFATLLARRFGQSFAGWLVGFPFTSAPVSLFLAVEHGTEFAASAAVGSIASAFAAGVYALVYARAARRGWPLAVIAAALVWAVVAAASKTVAFTPLLLTLLVWAGLLVVARLMPPVRTVAPAPPAAAWDLPARMVVATALVVGITSAAPLLGPFTSGMLSGFPIYATVLAVFAQRELGAEAGIAVMRGLTAGVFAFATFFFVIASFLGTLGIATTFVLATVAIVLVQAASFVLLRRST